MTESRLMLEINRATTAKTEPEDTPSVLAPCSVATARPKIEATPEDGRVVIPAIRPVG